MKDLFYMGGPLFMGILTIVFIVMLAWAIYHFHPVLLKQKIDVSKKLSTLKHIKTIGSFALVTGILGQLVGLYGAFEAVEQAGGVVVPILMGGLKVSMIPTIYGVLIFLISLLLWLITDFILSKKSE